ncbi:MAG TPA: hypothetical protein PKK10_00205 [Woeseiaceae bacterium]|nr:hypothetical protein [Woeseiaceae bacterium]
MLKSLLISGVVLFLPQIVVAEEPASDANDTTEVTESPVTEATAEKTPNGDGIDSPKAMSGMSILGNEEAPKALVIVPWKSSELGEAISLSDTLDDRARPVDKEVFLRELRFYEIRSGS